MHVFMTGGTGLLGRALCQALSLQGARITVYSRQAHHVPKLCGAHVQGVDHIHPVHVAQADVIVNLAGEPIANAYWSTQRKQLLRDSRIGITQKLLQAVKQTQRTTPISAWINGSAIGIYGNTEDQWVDESDVQFCSAAQAKGDFAAQLCQDWEQATLQAQELAHRVILLRTGLVLSRHGGLWPRLATPARLGLAAQLGHGKQYQSWIHITDWVNAVMATLNPSSTFQGAINVCAPQPATQAQFTQAMAKALSRPQWLTVSAMPLRWALGEMSQLLLEGQRVRPGHLQNNNPLLPDWTGFRFPDLNLALQDISR